MLQWRERIAPLASEERTYAHGLPCALSLALCAHSVGSSQTAPFHGEVLLVKVLKT